jgi:hypothetical protein
MKVRHIDKDFIEIEGKRFRKQLVQIGSGHKFWGVLDWKPGYILDIDTWVEREQVDWSFADLK